MSNPAGHLGPKSFTELTSLRIGGTALDYREATSEAELIETIKQADATHTPLLVIGEGSNLVPSDQDFPGIVVRDARKEIRIDQVDTCGGANATVSAGYNWDRLVQYAISEEWVGLEALSGIPGTVGAAPVQNIGAYGQEVATSLANVRTWDRAEQRVRTLSLLELGLGYRTSILKRSMRPQAQPATADPSRGWFPTPRYVVLEVGFQFRLGTRSAEVQYAELAKSLGIQVGERAPAAHVRAAVLELRESKGMLLNPADHDAWSAGSFFTNPVLSSEQAGQLPPEAPRYPVASALPAFTTGPATGKINPDLVKTSAAWLIQNAGFGRGFSLPGSAAALSDKHVLAITNRGGATAAQVRELALAVRAGVQEKFGITLVPEPVLLEALDA